jgi:threonine aldolase
MVDRLADDHANAKILEEGLKGLGIRVLNPVMTNMVFIDPSSIGWTGDDWMKACNKIGWKSRGSTTRTRLCTHYGIEREDIESFLEGLGKLLPKK